MALKDSVDLLLAEVSQINARLAAIDADIATLEAAIAGISVDGLKAWLSAATTFGGFSVDAQFGTGPASGMVIRAVTWLWSTPCALGTTGVIRTATGGGGSLLAESTPCDTAVSQAIPSFTQAGASSPIWGLISAAGGGATARLLIVYEEP